MVRIGGEYGGSMVEPVDKFGQCPVEITSIQSRLPSRHEIEMFKADSFPDCSSIPAPGPASVGQTYTQRGRRARTALATWQLKEEKFDNILIRITLN